MPHPAAVQRDPCGEGYEVDELVASLRRRGRRLQGPEHRDGEAERHDYGEGNVEVLAPPPGCIWGRRQRQAPAYDGRIRG